MPMFDVGDLDNAKEVVAAKPGEYQLKVVAIDQKEGKESQKPYLNIRLEIVNPDTLNPPDALVDDIYHMLMIPDPSKDPKQFARSQQNIKEFCTAFGVPTAGGFNTDNAIGKTGWGIVENQEYQGRQSARIKSFQRPRGTV